MIISPLNCKVRPCAAYQRQIINYLADMRHARVTYAIWFSASENNIIDNIINCCESCINYTGNISRYFRTLSEYLVKLDSFKILLLRRIGRGRR